MYLNKITIILLLLLLFIITNLNTNYSEGFYNNNLIEYVAWTGGFDSTFVICKFLFIDNKIVQPIYINPENIDNCKTCNYKRNSKNTELTVINKVINYIKKYKPKYSNNLLPLIYINKVPYDSKITNEIFKLKLFSRKNHQYEALSRLSKQKKIYINIGIVDIIGNGSTDLTDDIWCTYLRNHLTQIKNNNNINYKIINKNHPLSYIKFPIAYLTKSKLLKIAKKNKFDNILYMSWSCWFPVNNKPCGKCPMCKARIIPHT